jgi:hypothetical protein
MVDGTVTHDVLNTNPWKFSFSRRVVTTAEASCAATPCSAWYSSASGSTQPMSDFAATDFPLPI